MVSKNQGSELSQVLQFQLFGSDPISPFSETKRVLLSQQVDKSCISGDQFIWPFVFTPPPDLSSSSASGSTAAPDSSAGQHSPAGRPIKPKAQLMVTIYRHGRLTTRNVGYVLAFHPLCHCVLSHSRCFLQIEAIYSLHAASGSCRFFLATSKIPRGGCEGRHV